MGRLPLCCLPFHMLKNLRFMLNNVIFWLLTHFTSVDLDM
jgi:hypothetical protein